MLFDECVDDGVGLGEGTHQLLVVRKSLQQVNLEALGDAGGVSRLCPQLCKEGSDLGGVSSAQAAKNERETGPSEELHSLLPLSSKHTQFMLDLCQTLLKPLAKISLAKIQQSGQ